VVRGQEILEDVAGDCSLPSVIRDMDEGGRRYVDKGKLVRCRGCLSCSRSYRGYWTLRCQAEMLDHEENIFFTGTYAKQTDDLEQVRTDLKKFLYRVRSKHKYDNRCKVRYMVVTERHKSGNFHVHGVFHGDWTMDCDVIERCWGLGRVWADYCDLGAAGYVSKYIGKDLAHEGKKPRMMASRFPTYGERVVNRDEEVVKELMRLRITDDVEAVWAKNMRMMLIEDQPKSGLNLLRKLITGEQTMEELEYRQAEQVKYQMKKN